MGGGHFSYDFFPQTCRYIYGVDHPAVSRPPVKLSCKRASCQGLCRLFQRWTLCVQFPIPRGGLAVVLRKAYVDGQQAQPWADWRNPNLSLKDAGGEAEDSPLCPSRAAPRKRLKLDHGRPTQPTPANPTDGCKKHPRKIRPGPRFSLPGRLSGTTRLGKDTGGQHDHRTASQALLRPEPRAGDKKIEMRYGTHPFSYSIVGSFGSGTLDIIVHACEICRRARWVLQFRSWVSPFYRVGTGF